MVLQDAPENFTSQDCLRWRFDLSMILTPQALLKWKIYWMVCCVSTGWLEKVLHVVFIIIPGLPSSPLLERVDDYQSKLVICEHPARKL